jgi:hypothetical protein
MISVKLPYCTGYRYRNLNFSAKKRFKTVRMFFEVSFCASVADPGSGAFLPPGSGMEQWSDPDPGSGISK